MRPRISPSRPAPAHRGLAPARATLDNGVVVLAKETRTTPAVTINLAFEAGTICDPADAPGAVHLLSRVIDRGTAARDAEQIAEEIAGALLGGDLEMNLVQVDDEPEQIEVERPER